ncbi:hypothetical protein P691DRAFT_217966 [Macrolepiota fuliginosa MF-IS2]|uniref:Uncharacterized protein n=1 Tax=Macrolepiota fuliginosa MF-IS2 TaxID=1400762 RepID=A0A9P5XBB5_9AGAR|nr:hypothetical protein P691DRAFT_217966 [Macrolepiota fuliginosa MF-IS2]
MNANFIVYGLQSDAGIGGSSELILIILEGTIHLGFALNRFHRTLTNITPQSLKEIQAQGRERVLFKGSEF